MSNQERQREILNKRLIASEPEPGCRFCGEAVNNTESDICQQCRLESDLENEYWQDVKDEQQKGGWA